MRISKKYIFIIFLLFTTLVSSQRTAGKDRALVDANIDYYIEQAQLNINKHNYYEAKQQLIKAIKIAVDADNKKKEGVLYALKAKLKLIVQQEDSAITSINRAIKIQESISDYENLGKSYEIFGHIYSENKEFSKALDKYNHAKSIFQNENLNECLGLVLLSEVKIHLKLNDLEKAKATNEQAILLARENGYFKTKSDALVRQGQIYSLLGDNKKALEFTQEGIKIAKENNYARILNGAYLNLSEINNNIGNYKASNAYLKEHIKLSDSLRSINHEKLYYDQKVESFINSKIEENRKQAEELKKAENKNELNTFISILSVALIIMLSLLTLSLYRNNNIRIKTNNVLQVKNKELVTAKEKAELATKTKTNFLSTVTHELRTPLYAVTGLSNLLLEENPKPEQIPHLKSLKFSGDYLLTFINDILQINKIEANKVEFEKEVFNLKDKINNIILALNYSALENNSQIHLEYDSKLSENFIADQLKLSQILINLIGNAIKFTKNGDIWIRVYKINQNDTTCTLRFEIEDNGIGISQEKQNNLFDSFAQGSVQINRMYGGTGLGLYIVKGLVNLLKGKIYLKSELGKGTIFYCEIPMEYTTKMEVPEKAPTYFSKDVEKLDLTGVKILIVEDNKINQMITKKILSKLNLDCDVIDNGKEAVKLVKTNHYKVVLMDIHMPGISGIEATKLIREFNHDIIIIALTAVTIEDRMVEFKNAGFTDIIPKPFKQEEFEKKLYNALALQNSNTKLV